MIGPFVIMAALAALLFAGVKMIEIGARRDRGQPWSLQYRDDRTGQRADVVGAWNGALARDAALDACEVVREAQEIVRAAYRAGR